MFRKTVEHGVSYMGPFGAMGPKSKGIITYSWSPYVQKPFYGLFSKSITNMAHRVASSLPFIAPAIILNLGIFYWAETTYAKNQLKDPRDFDSDPDGGFMAFQTSGFKLHSFETPTRYTFVLLTAVPTTGSAFDNRSASPAVPQTAQVLEDLRKLYSDCFVPQVVRNPLARLPTESYIVSSDNRMIPASMRKTPDLCPEMVFGTDSSPIMLGSTFDKMVLFWANGLSYSGLTPEGKAM